MKIQAAAALLAPLANAYLQPSDIYYHQHNMIGAGMWGFGSDGVTIYSVDGSRILKSHTKESVCGGSNCYFFDVASDGKKYVWATVLQGEHRIDVYSIDTGMYVTSIPTCNTPLTMGYNPLREEMYTRCARAHTSPYNDTVVGNDPDLTEEVKVDGTLEVFSVNTLSATHERVMLVENREVSAYGRHVIDASLMNYGYATVYNDEHLIKFDLNTKEVVDRFDLEKSYGSYDVAYSQVNKHIFIRSRVCCTCGFEGADSPSSCNARPINPELGNFAGQTGINGTCGSGCEGSMADTIGVYEFDSVSETFVAQHNIKDGNGADPRNSPDGMYILLFGNDGGKNLRILKAGANGSPSTLHADVPVDFKGARSTTAMGMSDYAFVQDENRNLLIVAAAFDNEIAVIDMMVNPPTLRKVSLTAAEEATGGRSRAIEWVVGTNYVWVGGSAVGEVYVLEVGSTVDSVMVKKTLTDVTSSQFMYVENYQTMATHNQVFESQTFQDATNDDDDNAIEIAAIVLAALAFAMSLATFALVVMRPTPAAAAPGVEDGDKSLKSKQFE